MMEAAGALDCTSIVPSKKEDKVKKLIKNLSRLIIIGLFLAPHLAHACGNFPLWNPCPLPSTFSITPQAEGTPSDSVGPAGKGDIHDTNNTGGPEKPDRELDENFVVVPSARTLPPPL